ncbi:PP2C family protein-serine/threonine phosphatase [Nocardioides caeni]|uniref:PP2C family protein-serine/threonine phosphatase n=1 Tax=Nocardioides caeni TaxID=574700 RepID=UPI00130511A4|nr:protein phosphatase 2C domain-containing protein [Nocardioides caeni]
MTSPTLEVRWGTATDVGHRRADNQDALLAGPPVFAVADGMGGHRAGREAADLVVAAFASTCARPWTTSDDVLLAVARADEAVRQLGGTGPAAPGSTVSGVALACPDGIPSWLVFNIGDSRTYLLRAGQLELVTVDHSYAQVLEEQGCSDDVRSRAPRNVIMRAIGGGLREAPLTDQWLVPAEAGDRLLVCSDGLTTELSEPLLAALLLSTPDPAAAAQGLIAAALDSAARDNVTAVVVDAIAVRRPAVATAPDEDTLPDLPTVPR